MRLVGAWGFRFKSCGVWRKPKLGTGYWWRSNGDFILVATRGEPVAPAPGTQMIERLWPDTPKVEMFARAARDGWDVWGAGAPRDGTGKVVPFAATK